MSSNSDLSERFNEGCGLVLEGCEFSRGVRSTRSSLTEGGFEKSNFHPMKGRVLIDATSQTLGSTSEDMENGSNGSNRGRNRKTKGRSWRKKQKNKRGEEERKVRPRILFLDINRNLVGIDLDGDYVYDRAAAAAPPLVPICCRLNLEEDQFPIGMRHIKTKSEGKEDQVYLVGGAIYDLSRRDDWIDPVRQPGWVNYSDKVYMFDHGKIRTLISSHHDNGINISAKDVLIPLPNTLKGPKFPLVANLNGTFYFMNVFMNYNIERFIPCFKPQAPFERFDPITSSFHEEPFPFAYNAECNSSSLSLDMNDFPVVSHFCMDNKLILVCRDRALRIFDADAKPPSPRWTVSHKLYNVFQRSFALRHEGPTLDTFSHTGLWWISDFYLPSSLSRFQSLGVMLAIRLVPYDGYVGSMSYCYDCTLQLHAYAMSKKNYQLHFYQKLDDVFSDLLPLPTSTTLNLLTRNHHFLDLGKGGDEGLRRICVILTIDGLANGIAYLFVSVFDLRMKPGPYPKQEKNYSYYHFSDDDDDGGDGDGDGEETDEEEYEGDGSWPFVDEFLEVVYVKKRVFRLNQSIKEELNPMNSFIAYDRPPLDATTSFILPSLGLPIFHST
ncbi:hypothetical protein RIF29_08606 [Crotalaria pallida]|uniref:Uncharacterized protein n=1 Tax=Crotalaria pallida TaxID=3830 RepID=A0AAN9ILJ7_CROPI